MNYHKFIIILSLFCCTITTNAQNDISKVNKAGFKYFSIKDTLSTSYIDSIRFISSGNNYQKKPVIIFVQGSGNESLILEDNKQYFSPIQSLIPKEYFNKYIIVQISKPGIPICSHYSESSRLWNNNRGNYKQFVQNDYLDYYVSSTIQVVDFFRSKSFVDTTKIYLIGHSQGASIAAKTANKYQNKISKLVFMSSHIYDRQNQAINNIRKKIDYGILDAKIAQTKIDSVYNNYNRIKEIVEHKDKYFNSDDINYYLYRYDYSFNYDPPIVYLLQCNIPTLFIYGGQDPAVTELDMIPLIYTRANKTNYKVQCYPKYDHNYWLREYDSNGNILTEEYNWPNVFIELEKWLVM